MKFTQSFIISFLLIFSVPTIHFANAEEPSNGSLYNEGVASKAINPLKENYAEWINDNNTEYLPAYNEGIQDGIISRNIS